MDTLLVIFALALPVILGGLWLDLLVPRQLPARWLLVWGNGALLGIVGITIVMRILDTLGQPLLFGTVAVTTGLLALAALPARHLRNQPRTENAPLAGGPNELTALQRTLFYTLLGLVLLRAGTLSMEVIWRPLFPWDATMHWATKARVWFEFKGMLPFVSNHEWLKLDGAGVFTDRHAGYPATIPLLQVWMNLALGRWHESLMNLPWLLCFLALGATFFAQLRIAGVNALVSMGFTYLLLSMPLLNIHVALAGYADLLLGALYGTGVMAFHNWVVSRQPWQVILAVLLLAGGTLVKNEGLIWALTTIPAVILFFRGWMSALLWSTLFALLALLALLLLPESLILAGHTLKQLAPRYSPDALAGVIKSIWLHDNWHLFGYMLLGLIPVGLLMAGTGARAYTQLTATLGFALLALLFLLTFTGYGWGASNFAAVGRLCLQLAPGLMFLCALLGAEILQGADADRVPAQG